MLDLLEHYIYDSLPREDFATSPGLRRKVGPEGELTQTMELSGQILGLSAAGGYCALLTGSELAIYTRELAPYATLTTTQGARLVSLSPNGSALLANDEQAWLYIPD